MLTLSNLKRENFEPNEFFDSWKANELKIKNYPTPGQEFAIFTCLMVTADLMQEIRNLLQKPITISSAYRCLELNRAVGSKDSSQHVQGLACDFVCPDFGTPKEIVTKIKEGGILVDQCFNEGSWVHVSRALQKDKNRNMIGHYLIDSRTKERKFKPF